MAEYVALRPQFDRDAELWTYRDAVEHILDTFEVDRSSLRSVRMAMRSISQVMRDLPTKSRWSVYESRMVLKTEGVFEIGRAHV